MSPRKVERGVQDRSNQIPMDMISKIIIVSPPASKKETQTFFRHFGLLKNAHYKL